MTKSRIVLDQLCGILCFHYCDLNLVVHYWDPKIIPEETGVDYVVVSGTLLHACFSGIRTPRNGNIMFILILVFPVVYLSSLIANNQV